MNHMKDAAIDAHNATMAEYEAMTFKELIRQTIDHSFDGVMPPDDWIEMLRRVAIREASVGKVSIKHVVAVGNFVDDAKITFSKRPQDRVWRDYDLIPQETP